jgi:hypothetical protein
MYTPTEREQLRESLIAAARADERIMGIAITGSAATDREDQWSDIDLAFGIDITADVHQTIASFTDVMYRSNGALHHFDVPSGAWIYRVFFLANTLQVDLAFVPADSFGALAPTFRLIYGTATNQAPAAKRDATNLIGWAWLYALHARSSLARRRYWQAEYMITCVRNQVLALACLRHGLPVSEGRGFDDLPRDVTAPLFSALIGELAPSQLSHAFVTVTNALIAEMCVVDSALADRLAGPLRELTGQLP